MGNQRAIVPTRARRSRALPPWRTRRKWVAAMRKRLAARLSYLTRLSPLNSPPLAQARRADASGGPTPVHQAVREVRAIEKQLGPHDAKVGFAPVRFSERQQALDRHPCLVEVCCQVEVAGHRGHLPEPLDESLHALALPLQPFRGDAVRHCRRQSGRTG